MTSGCLSANVRTPDSAAKSVGVVLCPTIQDPTRQRQSASEYERLKSDTGTRSGVLANTECFARRVAAARHCDLAQKASGSLRGRYERQRGAVHHLENRIYERSDHCC